jgi:hypothetical protein
MRLFRIESNVATNGIHSLAKLCTGRGGHFDGWRGNLQE